jgi:hypothetical protein
MTFLLSVYFLRFVQTTQRYKPVFPLAAISCADDGKDTVIVWVITYSILLYGYQHFGEHAACIVRVEMKVTKRWYPPTTIDTSITVQIT